MTTLDDLKNTFFDECVELLQEMEQGLTSLREGLQSDDTVNAVFRAVHSVKGGAGIFGFETLVKFAHVFETVLDAVRRDSLPATQEVVAILLASGDVLSDLVNMARSDEAAPDDYGAECRAQLEALMSVDGAAPAEAEEMVDFDDIDFTPVRFDEMDAEDEGEKLYTIFFRPNPDMLTKGNEPLHILRGLRQLGELTLTTELSGLPALSDIQPDVAYVAWTATLRTTAKRADIDELFEFAASDCTLDVSVETLAAPTTDAQPPAFVAPEPEPPPAAAVQPVAPPPVAPPPVALRPVAPPPIEAPPSPPAAPAPKIAAPVVPPPPSDEDGEAKKPRPGAATPPPATTTRVDLDKIDRVVNMVGELVIAQAMLGQVVQGLSEEASGRLQRILEEVTHHTRELKDTVMSMRAQPVRAVFQRMPRLVRELSAKTAKKVKLEMAGEATEVDRTIIERLSDPLTHIIRNSVDHGIESPDDRRAAGKHEEGTIHLSADHRGGRIVIEIRDDGAGINTERVLRKAREKKLVDADASLSEDEISNLIFMPGFSTAESVSDISGRGVGMDVVRRNIQELGGRISLKSERGKGMVIQLALPLTLAVMDGMMIKVGAETYVTPMSTIMECLRPARSDVHGLIGTRGMLRLRGDLVPLVHLGELLAVDSGVKNLADGVVIITEAGEGARLGLVVDELLGHQQVVIKSIEESYGAVPGIAAATILGNGRVAFILDTEKLSELASENVAGFGHAASLARPSASALLN